MERTVSSAIGGPRLAEGFTPSYLTVKPNFTSELPTVLACALSPIPARRRNLLSVPLRYDFIFIRMALSNVLFCSLGFSCLTFHFEMISDTIIAKIVLKILIHHSPSFSNLRDQHQKGSRDLKLLMNLET